MNVWKVYLITNAANGKGYVGITSKAVELRLREHVRDAFPGRRNPNGTLYALHAAFHKYGQERFSISELEVGLSLAQARARERYHIETLGTYGGGRGRRGYNQTLGGEMPDEAYGYHQSSPPIATSVRPQQAPPSASRSSQDVQNERDSPSQIGYVIGLILAAVVFVYYLSQ